MNTEFTTTFEDKETQSRFIADTIQMLSTLSDKDFMEKYFYKRLNFNDGEVFTAIWEEYRKRRNRLIECNY